MGHKSGLGFLVAITETKTQSTVQEIKQKSTQKRNYSVYLDQRVIFIKERKYYRMNKIYKIHNYQFSKN